MRATYIRVNYYREMCVVLVRGHNQPIHAAFSRKSIRIEVASSTRLVRTHRYFTTTRHARLEEQDDERKETTLLLGSIT